MPFSLFRRRRIVHMAPNGVVALFDADDRLLSIHESADSALAAAYSDYDVSLGFLVPGAWVLEARRNNRWSMHVGGPDWSQLRSGALDPSLRFGSRVALRDQDERVTHRLVRYAVARNEWIPL